MYASRWVVALKRAVLSMLFGLALLPGIAGAETLDSRFADGNNAFWNGDYAEAIEVYEKLGELGVKEASLSYNLGTAYARIGKLGHAIQNFEIALQLDPGHADATHNLAEIREFIARRANEAGRDADLAPAVGPWRAILDRFTLNGAAWIFLVFYLSFFGVLLGRRMVLKRELPRLSMGVLAGICAVLFVVFGSVTAGKVFVAQTSNEAIVTAQNVAEVFEGPGSEVKRFVLEEGMRVKILAEQDGWIRLHDDEGRDGWVTRQSVGAI